MIGFWQDEFLKDEACEKLIDLFDKTHPNILEKEAYNQHHKDCNFYKRGEGVSYCMEMANRPDDTVNRLQEYAKYLKNSQIDWCHVVKGGDKSSMNLHYDQTSDKTTMTSLIYLNDNFRGGETYLDDGTVIAPKKGRILFFDGKYFKHGVNTTHGERYVLSTWYRSLDENTRN